jgi:hypothetical protein
MFSFQDSSSTKLYKNIFFLICIILFVFFLSNEKNMNDIFVKKESMKYVFLIIIIYFSFYQMNLSFIVIPLSLFFIMRHPKFPSMISSLQNISQSYLQQHSNTISSLKMNEYKENIENVENGEDIKKEDKDENLERIQENKKNMNENENEVSHEINIDELQELYISIKKELEEIDSKPIS